MFFKNLFNSLKRHKVIVTFFIFLLIGSLIASIVFITLRMRTSEVPVNDPSPIQATCRYYYRVERLYTCSLSTLEPITSATILEINGAHLANHTDADVEAVYYADSVVEYFRGEVMRKFENLKSISIYDEPVKEISPTAFDVCPKLESLEFTNNQLTSLPSGMLKNCEKLIKFAVISYNVLSVPGDLFGMTKNLEFLVLSGNVTSLPDNLVQNMEKLLLLNIGQNQLSHLSPNFLKNCPNLRNFYADSNKFEDDKSLMDVLKYQSNLEFLWISDNKFSNFDFNLLSQFKKLTHLIIGWINGPQLTNISWQSLPRSLTYLSVDGIGENVPEDAFTHLEGLDILLINGFGIDVLHKDTFKTLGNLTYLYVTGSKLTTLPSDLFVNQINLIELSMSSNLLSRLNADIFSNTLKLRTIGLSFNKINEIQRGTFSKTGSITYVDLSGNICIDGYIYGGNIDDDVRLTECFANWDNQNPGKVKNL